MIEDHDEFDDEFGESNMVGLSGERTKSPEENFYLTEKVNDNDFYATTG